MPYIDQTVRRMLDAGAEPHSTPSTAGELNYCLTTELIEYVHTKGLSYQTINDILGALEGAKAEFYRRVAVPYEESKISTNGDVY